MGACFDGPSVLSKIVKARRGEAKLTGAEVRGPSEGGMPPDFGGACAEAVVAVAARNATDKRAAARTDPGRLGMVFMLGSDRSRTVLMQLELFASGM